MKKIMLFFVACISCITVACDSYDDGTKGDDNKFPAPEVTFSAITGVSFTAGWNALETADSYRYEVSYEKDGQVIAVAAQNTETTTFSLDGLLPATDYSVRVVAKAGGKTISDWFSGTVRTLGGESVTFTVTPYERYIENAFIYPYAEVKPSDSEVYYWVSAIPSNSERDPKEWMQEDIDYYMELGKTWDDLVADKLILKGDAESVPFAFTGYDHYYFIVAPVGKNLSEIVVSGEVSRSYRFWYEAREVQMLHESTYEQFAGEWLLQTSGTVKEENGSLDVQEVGEEFPVTISPADDKKSFYLKGWGGDRNKFRDFAIKMDFEPAEDNYHKIGISFPQDIETEGDIVWKYVSWYNFVGTVGDEKVYTYLPYVDKMYENMPSWSKGFIGFMGNLNKTVIKICPLYYMDGNNEGAYIMSMWPYGISSTGDVEQDKLLNNKYEDPVGPYYLIRKDVADGLVLQLPDTEEPDADVAGLLNALQSVRQANTPREVFSVKR